MHSAAGGNNPSDLCWDDMLLEWLVARRLLRRHGPSHQRLGGHPCVGGSVTDEDELDFQGTLGVKAKAGGNVGVGFQTTRLVVK
jgi:hypothetical protein